MDTETTINALEPEQQEQPEPPVFFYPSIERLRIILMFFMCINLFGFPTMFGEFVKTICGFVAPAFFILSGFLVLREEEDRPNRIRRAIKRCALVFGILLVVYFAINFVYYRLLGVNIFSAFASKRFWFNFLVLNVWQFDIGGAIWYVQALLYAYIIIYFLEKWNLLRFDGLIAAVLILFTVLTGELSGLFPWEILGYTYLPGNFLTRALPYVLLGSFIYKKMPALLKVGRLWYWLGILLGVILSVAEILLLGFGGVPGYYGHLIGIGITAFSVCMLAFQDDVLDPGFECVLAIYRWQINCIYYICQPLSVGIVLLLSIVAKNYFAYLTGFMGIITFVVCLLIVLVISRISTLLKTEFVDDLEDEYE